MNSNCEASAIASTESDYIEQQANEIAPELEIDADLLELRCRKIEAALLEGMYYQAISVTGKWITGKFSNRSFF